MQKNILIFIDWFLPGTKAGGPVRSMANLTEHLAGEFTFWIVTRNTDYCESTPYPNIVPNTWIEHSPNIWVYYASAENQNYGTFKQLITSKNYDKIYINGIYSLRFSILPLLIARLAKKPVMVAPRGMLNPQAFSAKAFKKKIFLAIMKMSRLYNRVTFHATNQNEQEHIVQLLGKQHNVTIAPNLFRKLAEKPHAPNAKESGTVRMVNIARISPEKGTLHMFEFLQNCTIHNIELDIYGPVYAEGYWQQCEALISKLPSNIRVNYKGAVEGDKVPETIANYHFFMMPTEGENFGHSILEALSAGCPVIISDQTPWRNLAPSKAGWDIPLQTPEAFIAAIEKAAAMGQEEYNQWSAAAYNHAKAFCNNPAILEANRKLFDPA